MSKVLPLVPNRFVMKKEQWPMADRAWIERDAAYAIAQLGRHAGGRG